jgi:methionyl-tRNA synthetase
MTKEQEKHLNQCFDFFLKHFVDDMRTYRASMIELIKEGQLKNHEFDKMFNYELAEEAMVFKGRLLLDVIDKEIKGKRQAMSQINDLLGD